MAEFTPGPWTRTDRFWPPRIVAEERPETQICMMSAWLPAHADEQQANARLIAAAPELFEALHNMVALAEPYFTDAPQTRALNAAVNALAKATGDQSNG